MEGGVVGAADDADVGAVGEAPALGAVGAVGAGDDATRGAPVAAEVDDAFVPTALVPEVVLAAAEGVTEGFVGAVAESVAAGADEAIGDAASAAEPAEAATAPAALPADAVESVDVEEAASSPAEDFAEDLEVAVEVAVEVAFCPEPVPEFGPVLATSGEASSVEAADFRVARLATEGATSSEVDAPAADFEASFDVDFVAFAAGAAAGAAPDSPDSTSDASATMVAVAAAPPAFANHSRIVSARPTETGDKWVAISGISSAWQRATMSLELTPSSLAS